MFVGQDAEPTFPLSAMFGSLRPDGEGVFVAETSPEWMQGRTLYGGASAALCVEGARRAFPGMPMLRAAQFAFIGPAGGEVRIASTLLRRGRSAATVNVDLTSEAGIGVRALLTYAAARAGDKIHTDLPAPDAPPPEDCEPFYKRGRPAFGVQFEARTVSGVYPGAGETAPDILAWYRHKDRSHDREPSALIALADVPPPAAMGLVPRPAAISSMTWSMELLNEVRPDDDGWRLLRSTAVTLADGYSSQSMMLWDRHGLPLLISRQLVAVFT